MKRQIFYTSEESDDFSPVSVNAKTIDKRYVYPHKKSALWRGFSTFVYRAIATPLAALYCKIKLGDKYIGRKKLRSVRGGCFFYMNHTMLTGDALTPNVAVFPRRNYMIVHPDNVSLPIIGKITPMLGALPLPGDAGSARGFSVEISEIIRRGGSVTVYPEAHVWPYFTGIRNFPSASFSYPVRLGAPVFALTRTFSRGIFGRVKSTVYIDGPFYPDPSMSAPMAREALADAVRSAMRERAALSTFAPIEYIKVEKTPETSENVNENLQTAEKNR